MTLKWGSTTVTAVKWGNTNCTAVYWGSTKVWPDGVYVFGEYIGQYNESNMTVRTSSGLSYAPGSGAYGGHAESNQGYFIENDRKYYESDHTVNDRTTVTVTLSIEIPSEKTLHIERNTSGLWTTDASKWEFYSPYNGNSSNSKYAMFTGNGSATTGNVEHTILLAYNITKIEMYAEMHKGTHFIKCWYT